MTTLPTRKRRLEAQMFGSVSWNDRLMQRYGHLDRQCGYPVPADFVLPVAPLDLLRALRDSRKAQRPLSLAVQLPMLAHDEMTTYLQHLRREVDLLACHLGDRPRVEQLRLNAGRASAEQLRDLLDHLKSRFQLASPHSGDFVVEVELAGADWPLVGLLRELGFNGLSVNVPDLHAEQGGTVEYFRSSARIRTLIEAARALQYRTVNVDLGYGRSWQTVSSFARKLDSIVELQPDRVTLFDYRQLATGTGLASAAASRAMHRYGIERLAAAGYRFIGLGRFVLPHDELAMAQEIGGLHHDVGGYTHLEHCDYLGLGVGAISRVGDLYVQNLAQTALYQQALAQDQLPTWRGLPPARVDRALRTIVERLLCNGRVDFAELHARFGVAFRQQYAPLRPLLRQLQRDGLLRLRAHGIELQPDGGLVVSALCAALVQPELAYRMTDALTSADSASQSAR